MLPILWPFPQEEQKGLQKGRGAHPLQSAGQHPVSVFLNIFFSKFEMFNSPFIFKQFEISGFLVTLMTHPLFYTLQNLKLL